MLNRTTTRWWSFGGPRPGGGRPAVRETDLAACSSVPLTDFQHAEMCFMVAVRRWFQTVSSSRTQPSLQERRATAAWSVFFLPPSIVFARQAVTSGSMVKRSMMSGRSDGQQMELDLVKRRVTPAAAGPAIACR